MSPLRQKFFSSLLNRLLLAMLGALGVTCFLFLGMHSLIAQADSSDAITMPSTVIEFVRLKSENTLSDVERIAPKRQTVPTAPPVPKIPSAQASLQVGDVELLPMPVPMPLTTLSLAGRLEAGNVASDRDIVPFVRIDPAYPRRASERGVEGFVEVQFDIGRTGNVKSARVIRAEPPRVFNRAALAAIRRWKYKPQVVGGVAVEKKNIRVRLNFTLDKP